MNSRDIQRRLRAVGWVLLPGRATSHRQFAHPDRPGKVTVPSHGGRDLSPRLVDLIRKQAGISKADWEAL